MDKKKKYPCIESTLDIAIEDYTIRLWLNETEVGFVHNHSLVEKIKNYIEERKYFIIDSPTNHYEKFVEFIFKEAPNLNAVQVKQGEHGFVVYTVDFEKDPHG